MNVRGGEVYSGRFPTNTDPKEHPMNLVKKHAVPALMTTFAVLVVVAILRKAPVISPITRPLVDKALGG